MLMEDSECCHVLDESYTKLTLTAWHRMSSLKYRNVCSRFPKGVSAKKQIKTHFLSIKWREKNK